MAWFDPPLYKPGNISCPNGGFHRWLRMLLLVAAVAVMACSASCSRGRSDSEDYNWLADAPLFSSTVDNPCFPLKPGTTFVYEGTKAGCPESVKVYVSHETKDFGNSGSIPCIGVSENTYINGQLVRESLYWYTQSDLGEVSCENLEVKNYENGQFVNTEGSSDLEYERFLTAMAGSLYVGVAYLTVGGDWVSIVALNESVAVPYGSFEGCLKTKVTSKLRPGVVEYTYYAPGVGKVLTVMVEGGSDRLELVSVTY